MNEISAEAEHAGGHHRRVGCGVLPDDISHAVDIISTAHRIPGSSAYIVLVEDAVKRGLSVRQVAAMVVSTPGVTDQRDVRGELGLRRGEARATPEDDDLLGPHGSSDPGPTLAN